MNFYKYCPLAVIVFIAFNLPGVHGQGIAPHDSVSRFERIIKSGVLRLGVPGDYAPFAMAKGDSLYGADITLGRSLASALGVRPVFIKTSWPTLMSDMRNNVFDIALGGISITPERQALASFSVSYHTGGKTFLCRREDSARFSTVEAVDKSGVRIIVNHGGTNETTARSLFHTASIQVYPDNIGIFNEIIAGRADVMVTDDTEADLKAKQYPQLCRSYPGIIGKSYKALWIQKDPALVAFVNNWLQKEIALGMPQKWLNEAMAAGK